MSRAVLVAMIASRVGRKAGEGEVALKNRISKRVGTAIKKQALREAGPRLFHFADAGLWIRKEWPGLFDDFPMTEGTANAKLELPSLGGGGRARANSRTLQACQMELDKAIQRIISLERELQLARTELGKLRPLADADAQRRQKASKAGKEGGRGKEK